MIEKIKNIFVQIATFNLLGSYFLGGIISSLLAIPVLYFLQLGYHALPHISYSIWFVIVLICLVSIYIALKEHKNDIILHKFIGVMIVFFNIYLNLKILFSGILLFYFLDFIIPKFIFKHYNSDEHVRIVQMFYLIIPSVVSGFIVNLFLSFVLWIAH
jgi:hypothetical protein